MTDLTPERLAELRRIAEAATPGPWEWRMSKDGRILDLITLETGYNEEIITRSHISAWLQVNGGLKDFIPTFDPTTTLALLDEIERLQHEVMHLRDFLAESEAKASHLRKRYETLRAEVEDVADLLDRLRGAVEKARQLHCIDRDPYEDGRSVGWGTAVKWLRKALADHGGDDADGGVGAEVSDDAVAR